MRKDSSTSGKGAFTRVRDSSNSHALLCHEFSHLIVKHHLMRYIIYNPHFANEYTESKRNKVACSSCFIYSKTKKWFEDLP